MPEPTKPPVSHPAVPPREAAQRWRLVVRRETLDGEQVARTQQAAWEAALIATGLSLVGLDTESGRPRFAMAAPLAPAIPGDRELADVWLTERRPRWSVRDALEGALPAGSTLIDVYDVWLGEAALPGQVVASVYRATIGADTGGTSGALEAAAAALSTAETLPRERAKGDRTVAYDLRPFIDDIEVRGRPDGGIEIRMELRHDPEKGVGRPDEVLAELADRSGVSLDGAALVRERLVLASERPVVAPRQERRGPRAGRRIDVR